MVKDKGPWAEGTKIEKAELIRRLTRLRIAEDVVLQDLKEHAASTTEAIVVLGVVLTKILKLGKRRERDVASKMFYRILRKRLNLKRK